MTILPFEGSSDGKNVYEQAYMLWALDLIGKKKYADAMTKLEKSKAWPENLGVGKPYDADTRMQEYAEAFCLQKMNKSKEAEALQIAIVEYSNQQPVEPILNNILPLWVWQQKGDKAAAQAWIEKLNDFASQRPAHRWVVAVAKSDENGKRSAEMGLKGNPYFLIIEKLKALGI